VVFKYVVVMDVLQILLDALLFTLKTRLAYFQEWASVEEKISGTSA